MTSKFALVIANTEYQDASFAKLTAPGRDAEEFAQVLRELAAFDDVQVLLNEGEGRTRRSIARFFAERKRDDLLLLYFSGHGVRNEVGQLFLAANDTEIGILEASGIPAEFVTQSMNNSRSQRQLLILDCCNSGAFAYGTKSAAAVGKSMGIASAFEGSGFGRVVLTATDATQYAWEGDKVIGNTQKSVFTHFLIEGLKGEADRDSDGRIHVDELYDYAYEQVVRRTPKQTPGKWSYKQQGDIILRENLQPREVKPALLPSDLLELLSHPNSSVRRVGIQDLVSILNGKHLGLARGAEEKLREIAENDDSFSFRRTASEALTSRGLIVETPSPVEIPKEQQREEFKIEKPIGVPSRQVHSPRVDRVREKAPRALPNWKSIDSIFNLRVMVGIGALLVVVSLATVVLPVLRNLFAPGVGTTSPTPGIGSTMISDKDDMTLLYVPAGEFTMGNDNDSDDEKPVHTVTLDAFWIDQTEVTNAMYAKCVQDGKCSQPSITTHYDDSNYANHPVVYISWNDAKSYCSWADRRLPTEAEWEKAARWKPSPAGGGQGEGESLTYPWGNDFDGTKVNFCDTNCSFDWADKNSDDGYADTAPAGSYPSGASPYGALDMAGNVWEWVGSLYQPYPYDAGDGRENMNSTDARALRGGSWNYINYEVRSARRGWGGPTSADSHIGFRCSLSADEQVESNTSQPTATEVIAVPTLGIGSTMISDKDGMTLLYVPAGEFTMGSNIDSSDQRPAHTVYLDAFWVDKTEVTNAMYAQCVQDGNCQPPESSQSSTRESYHGISGFDNYPVIYVSWEDAKGYCAWADRRLPTEAEWEKAARGENAFIYPWGNDAPDKNFLNYNSEVGDTTEVGKYASGVSPYGALDMAGNVWEWVADWYDESYYSSFPASNPQGPASGTSRVRRGGSWINNAGNVQSADRDLDIPSNASYFIGFRCALTAEEQSQSTPLAQVETNTPQPIATDTPSSTEASISTTPALGIGSTMISDKDGMTLLYVPAGEFPMGSNSGKPSEKPVHTVYLNAFWIDQTEVTNSMYTRCVQDGECKSPSAIYSSTRDSYYGNSEFDNFPVTYVSWEDSKAYCSWADRRLPTEAEWEKAARGVDARDFPWGNSPPNASLLNYNETIGDTINVGNYPMGASPYGAQDMAGNVSEWVADLYRESYYASSPTSNPPGPAQGSARVIRGGTWNTLYNDGWCGYYNCSFAYGDIISYQRRWDSAQATNHYYGFRCAMSATP